MLTVLLAKSLTKISPATTAGSPAAIKSPVPKTKAMVRISFASVLAQTAARKVKAVVNRLSTPGPMVVNVYRRTDYAVKASIPSPAAPESVRDEMVRAHLRELLTSPIFAGAERLRRLLEYVVQSRLEGREAEVKEYTLGLEVFDRRPDYDTRTDSTVRVHVGKLRDRLRQYYLTEGSASPVCIELPRGSYVPDFVFVTPSDVRTQARPRASLRPWILGGIAGLAIGAAVVASIPFFQPPAPAHFQQLTFRRGAVSAARFAPDGSIVYSAAWEGNPNQLFIARPQEPDSR